MKIVIIILLLTFHNVSVAQFETNYSYSLNGSNSARTTAATFPTPNYVTITAWIYINTSGEQTVVAKNYDNTGTNLGQFEVFINGSGGLNFLTRVSGSDILSGSPGTLETGKWYFIAGKYDGTTAQSFINGVLSSSSATASGVVDNTSPHPFSVGCQEDGSANKRNHFNGLIENLAVWSTPIDITIIRDWMHKEMTSAHPYYSNLMAYYKFNGANGNSYMWDATSNGRNLFITGNTSCYSTTLPPTCYTYGDLKDDYSAIRGIWSSNLSNTSSILTITSSSITGSTFALWGHNNKSTSWTYFDIPNTVLRRMDRFWATEINGTPTGNFIFSTAGLTIADGTKLRMLVDTDGNFFNAQIVSGTYSSGDNTFTVNNVSIGDEYFYTLAELTADGGNSGPPSTPPQWRWKSPNPQGNNLRGVVIVDNNKFFAVGDAGTILYTENAGSSYTLTHYVGNFSKNLNACGIFPGTGNCITGGDNGGFFKSSDYGKTWVHAKDIGIPENYTVKDIHIIDQDIAFIGGSEGQIYKTTDRGTSWNSISTPLTGNIPTLSFYNAQVGWAFDDFSYARTTNGGNNWAWKFNLPAQVQSSLLLTETDGLIATSNGKIFKTTDLGDNWSEVYTGVNGINKLTKMGGGTLILGAGNNTTIIKSSDDGSTWTSPTQTPSVVRDLLNTYIIDNKSLFVGKNGIVMTSDKFVNTVDNITTGIMNGLYSAYITPTVCYAVVGRDKVYKSTDGGTTWQQAFNISEAKLNALTFSDNNNGLTVGDDGIIQKTTDGGSTFNDKSIGIGKHITDIAVQSSGSPIPNKANASITEGLGTLIILYTNTGTGQQIIAKSTDAGDNWVTIRSVSSASNEIATDISFAGSNIFVCTKDGKILLSTNTGDSWTTTSFQHPTSFTRLSFLSSTHGLAVGLQGIVYKTTNGGTDWVQKTSCSNDTLNQVTAMSENIAIVSSTTGSIYETKDGGNTWITSVTNLTNSVHQLLGVAKPQVEKPGAVKSSDYVYFAIGEGGMILENEGGGIGLFPVELTQFTGFVHLGSVTLQWATATEINNYGFTVERRLHGEEWKELGFVKGSGNSNSPKQYSFTDSNPPSGIVLFRLKQTDSDGNFTFSDIIEINVTVPREFSLYQNYPNPFNPGTTIAFTLSEDGPVTLTVYDVLGSKVTTLVNEKLKSGNLYRVDFDGSRLSSGIYFYRLESKGRSLTRKLMLLK